jgi:hypothetical protein
MELFSWKAQQETKNVSLLQEDTQRITYRRQRKDASYILGRSAIVGDFIEPTRNRRTRHRGKRFAVFFQRRRAMTMQTFEQVMEHLDKQKRPRHLLVGNGFSMAYDPSIFSYNALSRFIEDSKNDLLMKLFAAINSRNFEQIMKQLAISKDVILAFGGQKTIIEKIDHATATLKESLISAVKALHPEHVFTIPEDKSATCAKFLTAFLDKNGKIFSTNYDVLLYWVLMRNELPNAIDGFGKDAIDQGEWVSPEDVQWSELHWGNHRETQNVFYLHGALPLFDDGIEIIKEKYDGNYILENIKTRMEKGQYPVFVTAGTGDEKLNHILHNHYLSYCYDVLSTINGSLITFGFNFGESDDHIIRAINHAAKQAVKEKLWSVYIGVFSDEDAKHIESIQHKFKCKVNLYDSKTANIWGKPV